MAHVSYKIGNYQNPQKEIMRLEAQAKIVSSEMDLLKTAGIPELGQMIDVGCGPGFYTKRVMDTFKNLKMVGVDCDQEVLKKAINIIDARYANAYELPFESHTFDGALARLLLRHLENPTKALQEIIRVVRPGGSIIAIDSDNSTWLLDPPLPLFYEAFAIHERLARQSGADPHIGRKLFRMFTNSNLKNVQIYPFSVTSSEIGLLNFAQILLGSVIHAIDSDNVGKIISKQAYEAILEWANQRTSFGIVTAFLVRGIV